MTSLDGVHRGGRWLACFEQALRSYL